LNHRGTEARREFVAGWGCDFFTGANGGNREEGKIMGGKWTECGGAESITRARRRENIS
jgi:hypothetical protein